MPSLNGYIAHIALQEAHRQHIEEHNITKWDDGRTVSCYITAVTDKLFFAKWGARGRKSGIVPYSAEFIRDGESVNRILFDTKAARELDGQAADWEDDDGESWNFTFREFICTGS